MTANVMENRMKIAFAIYHLNSTTESATKDSLRKHPLLKDIPRKQLEEAFKTLWDWGHVQFDILIIEGKHERCYSLRYPESIRDYGIVKGWLKVKQVFHFANDGTAGEKKEAKAV